MAKKPAKKRAANSSPTKKRENFRTAIWEETFLQTLKRTGQPGIAAQQAGIDPSTAYRRKAKVPAFHEKWMAALTHTVEAVNTMVLNMVMNGTVEDVYHAGVVCGKRIVRYPYLIARWLEAHDRPRWGRNFDLANAMKEAQRDDRDGETAQSSASEPTDIHKPRRKRVKAED